MQQTNLHNHGSSVSSKRRGTLVPTTETTFFQISFPSTTLLPLHNQRGDFTQVNYVNIMKISLLAIVILFLFLQVFLHFQKQEQDAIFKEFAKLLTNPSTSIDQQTKEGTYAWYKDQLEKNNRLGNTLFKDPLMTRVGFQSTSTTSKELFYYFRTFDTKENCRRQHACQIFGDKTAGEFLEEGVPLDAVIHHCFYRPPFFLNSPLDEAKIVNEFQQEISLSKDKVKLNEIPTNEQDILQYSNLLDERFGEKMWRGMRRLSILMCSEAIITNELEKLTQYKNSRYSMKNFAKSTADISICFLSTCSVWVNYQYYDMSLSNSKIFGSKPFSKNKGICAFISNCDRGGTELKQRTEFLQVLSKYIPVKQFGKCGKNSQEGKGGKSFELENNCRFYFAAENSILKDYVTEKFFEGILALSNGAKMIMLYRGAPNLRNDFGFPESLFVEPSDFKSVDELGRFLKKLNEDDEAFEEYFNRMTIQERIKVDKAVAGFEHRLGWNTPCRICKIIGEMKLARYLLFKIGFRATSEPKINFQQWNNFKNQNFYDFSSERLKILDEIYFYGYEIFQKENNNQNEFNLGWKFD